jgi:hypothetical protein
MKNVGSFLPLRPPRGERVGVRWVVSVHYRGRCPRLSRRRLTPALSSNEEEREKTAELIQPFLCNGNDVRGQSGSFALPPVRRAAPIFRL